MSDVKKLLMLPHIQVHNANALSSPYTIGFPAMTAWLGAVHALQRRLNQHGIGVRFEAVGVVSHDVNLQTYKGTNDFVSSIIGTGNPLDKSGERSSFIEEARCHLEVSLVIECSHIEIEDQEQALAAIVHLLNGSMKLAGGDIQKFTQPYFMVVEEGDDENMRRFKRALMPGYALIERRDLIVEAMKEGADALEAIIDHLAIHHTCTVSQADSEKENEEENAAGENIEKVDWKTHRKTRDGMSLGWLVPIATGFQGVSELGEAKNQRDPDTPHRFAESVVTLGEFKMPHRLNRVEELLWRYHQEGDLYLCHQSSHEHLSSSLNEDQEYSEFE
ncbi:type I-F CRISPR-associated protein Csy2 [Marinomonas mediterranea]|uniref:CRISPR-associated protein, Csy2 family n=1 Tax=Marinomonas mediterranea (strain ATCC 700492 / JCM 21426 / NBRC 103028 / MMB-1) TaxID=717774 RepID=F2K499_MARM1|nr:type I-F CRISPR-associated protein Csy2 [Marinomonas mediterranea]ADZ92540.1 CRISPR-associated protein, Csy2 family [Marinomonas mediterranea MMB-1]WCN10486.1 type I-F CRISPR-associated protein Csy2 [Marinomonas mediterranea]WCN18585.1 type I-F CRISPR-associated protein Csy2 [Marinomonas mediterranea MMB-1]